MPGTCEGHECRHSFHTACGSCCCWPHQWLMSLVWVLGLVSASCAWCSPHVPLRCLMLVLEWGYHPLIGAPAGLLGWPFLLWIVLGFSLVWRLPTRICISALASLLCGCRNLPLIPLVFGIDVAFPDGGCGSSGWVLREPVCPRCSWDLGAGRPSNSTSSTVWALHFLATAWCSYVGGHLLSGWL